VIDVQSSLATTEKNFTHNLWLSTPNYILAEIAADMGFKRVLYDIEHGPFDLRAMFEYFVFCKALGFEIYAKVLAPERSAVQSALDFGADAVLIPHVQSVEDAERVCGYAKYPPLGDRSVSSGRVTRYQAGSTAFYEQQNKGTRCIPVIETAGALADIEKIAALPSVDAIFIGPTDLSLRRGRGAYKFSDEATADVLRCVSAAKANGKPWTFPAWTPLELELAHEHGAEFCFCVNEFRVLRQGMEAAAAKFVQSKV